MEPTNTMVQPNTTGLVPAVTVTPPRATWVEAERIPEPVQRPVGIEKIVEFFRRMPVIATVIVISVVLVLAVRASKARRIPKRRTR